MIRIPSVEITRACDQVRDGIGSPDGCWLPLECVLPMEECSGFMFMGAVPAAIVPSSRDFISAADADHPHDDWERRVIFRYKHGITRRYLNLSSDLRPYRYVGNAHEPDGLNVYAHIPGGNWPEHQLESAINLAFQGIEQMGASRSTVYDADYIAARNARLIEAGFRVVN